MKEIVYTQMMIELLQRIKELEEEVDQLKELIEADKIDVGISVKTAPFDKPCVTSSINKYGKFVKVE